MNQAHPSVAGRPGPGFTASLQGGALLQVRNLRVSYGRRGSLFRAVDDVSFDVASGETLGLVGESGSGKTTIGRAVLRLLPRADNTVEGSVRYDGTDLLALSEAELRGMRRHLQMVFQDPVSSFNPRRRVDDIVGEGLEIQGVPKVERLARIEAALRDVGFSRAFVAGRRPYQFSGGQCQRIAIARSLAVGPRLIVCDEPVASLDVSVQGHVINLLHEVQQRHGLSLIFISHDLAVVRNVSDQVAVLYMGRLVERGVADTIYDRPAHPYTRMLLEAVPVPDATHRIEPDFSAEAPPSRAVLAGGCRFSPRCPRARALCAKTEPVLALGPNGQSVACHFPHDEPAPGRKSA